MQGESSSDSKALTALLSPQGRLMSALHSADADALIMFKFPPERLPSHTQMLLANEHGRQAFQSCAKALWLVTRQHGSLIPL